MKINGSKILGRSARSSATASLSKKPIIWKVLIFAAGTDTVNGEYVWDGKTLFNNKPVYKQTQGAYALPETIQWVIDNNKGAWALYDYVGMKYASSDLITWTQETNVPFGLISPAVGAGNAPGPKVTFGYSPSASVVGFTIGAAGTSGIAGTYKKTEAQIFEKVFIPCPACIPEVRARFIRGTTPLGNTGWNAQGELGEEGEWTTPYYNSSTNDTIYTIDLNMFRQYTIVSASPHLGVLPRPLFSQVFYY